MHTLSLLITCLLWLSNTRPASAQSDSLRPVPVSARIDSTRQYRLGLGTGFGPQSGNFDPINNLLSDNGFSKARGDMFTFGVLVSWVRPYDRTFPVNFDVSLLGANNRGMGYFGNNTTFGMVQGSLGRG